MHFFGSRKFVVSYKNYLFNFPYVSVLKLCPGSGGHHEFLINKRTPKKPNKNKTNLIKDSLRNFTFKWFTVKFVLQWWPSWIFYRLWKGAWKWFEFNQVS